MKSKKVKPAPPAVDIADLMECIDCLRGVVGDILPQIGGLVLQDYGRLNRGLILLRKIGKPLDK